jgi:NADH-quinone oxidoreductase subunit J
MTVGNVFFALCSIASLVGALSTVLAKNPIRGAMGLLLTIVGIAGLFLKLNAQFLAAIQLIVYAGAVVVLFVFVIMLLGPDAGHVKDTGEAKAKLARAFAGVLMGLMSLVTLFLVLRAADKPARFGFVGPTHGSVEAVGQQLFTKAVVPFELATALLIDRRGRRRDRGRAQPSPDARAQAKPERDSTVVPRSFAPARRGASADGGGALMNILGNVVEHYVLLASVIFTIGGIGFLVRRNVLVQLMCVELMLNAVNLVLVAFNRRHVGDMNGQVFSFFIIAVAAAEAAVGLAIVLSFYRLKQTVFSDEADQLRH